MVQDTSEDDTITGQPMPTPLFELIKRPSVRADAKIELSDEDDEVFCEGVGPPVNLASNLGTPHNKNSLPRWFSRERDRAMLEPPATPVGRDELALKRHRMLSELLDTTENTKEHRVHFDPSGPRVAGGEQTTSSFLSFYQTLFCFKNSRCMFFTIIIFFCLKLEKTCFKRIKHRLKHYFACATCCFGNLLINLEH